MRLPFPAAADTPEVRERFGTQLRGFPCLLLNNCLLPIVTITG